VISSFVICYLLLFIKFSGENLDDKTYFSNYKFDELHFQIFKLTNFQINFDLVFISAFYYSRYHFELFVGIETMPGMSRNNDAIA